jgi:hypothetical protein
MGRSSSALACASQGRKRESTDQPGERPGTRVSPAGTRVSLRVLVIQTTMALECERDRDEIPAHRVAVLAEPLYRVRD